MARDNDVEVLDSFHRWDLQVRNGVPKVVVAVGNQQDFDLRDNEVDRIRQAL